MAGCSPTSCCFAKARDVLFLIEIVHPTDWLLGSACARDRSIHSWPIFCKFLHLSFTHTHSFISIAYDVVYLQRARAQPFGAPSCGYERQSVAYRGLSRERMKRHTCEEPFAVLGSRWLTGRWLASLAHPTGLIWPYPRIGRDCALVMWVHGLSASVPSYQQPSMQDIIARNEDHTSPDVSESLLKCRSRASYYVEPVESESAIELVYWPLMLCWL